MHTGTNKIQKILGDCAIEENFDGNPGINLKGASFSAYNTKLNKWQQTWVDNNGSYMDFIGEFKDSKMSLAREVTRNGKKIIQRMTFHKIKTQELDWDWEISNDGGESWVLRWQLHYTRKKS